MPIGLFQPLCGFFYWRTRMQPQSIKLLKEKYIEYFSEVPVQKYAAMYIGRDEDTIIRWRKHDKDFADAVERSKAEWIRKKVMATKAEFALERLDNSMFGPKAFLAVDHKQELTFDPHLADDFVDFITERTRPDLNN